MISTVRSTESLVLHTVTPPELPPGYEPGSYRNVVGLEVTGRSLWLPSDQDVVAREEYEVPVELAHRAIDYAESHYDGRGAENEYRNCHVGAAAMTGAGVLTWIQACLLACETITGGEVVSDLGVGQWGVIGQRDPNTWPAHSTVGISPGFGLQTDRVKGPLSVVRHSANVADYRGILGPDVALYAPTNGNPKLWPGSRFGAV
jgi:hypothetical protein